MNEWTPKYSVVMWREVIASVSDTNPIGHIVLHDEPGDNEGGLVVADVITPSAAEELVRMANIGVQHEKTGGIKASQ